MLTRELDSLLNKLYEHSKTSLPANERLIVKNTALFLFEKTRTLLSIKGILAALIVLVPGSILSMTTTVFEPVRHLPLGTLLVVVLSILLPLYLLTRKIVMFEMTKIDSPFFHISLFEKLRPVEYRALIPLATQKDFINSLRDDLVALIDTPHRYDALLDEKNKAIRKLIVQLDSTEEKVVLIKEKYDVLLQFLFQLKRKLNLLVNDRFSLDSINFGTNYSLYKVTKDGLTFIDSYGVNKAELSETICFTQSDHPLVQAMCYSYHTPLITDHLVSWKRTLQDHSEWVLSLHLDESNRNRFLQTHVAKLNLTITQELLWICCELVNKFKNKSTTITSDKHFRPSD
ncbi:hypothetical protein [Alteribacter aurantiacus]|uniref:hypothetical protein n=1 Tax=Alteribacter aurantiacus TaxID=254410 RepID=UPI0003FE6A7C|nr:hypothetical protein [Alteribacter aurantiacus]